MKKILLLIFLFPLMVTAQIQVSAGFNYVTERTLTNNTSHRGGGLDISLRKHLSENLKLMANTGIYNTQIALTLISTQDYSNLLFGYHYKDVVPITIGAEYYLLTKRLIKPLVGLETGAYITHYSAKIDPNYLQLSQNLMTGNSVNWGFSPSIGVHIQEYTDRLGLFVKLKYVGITETNVGFSNLLVLNGGMTFKFGKKIKWKPPVIEVPAMAPYYEKKEN